MYYNIPRVEAPLLVIKISKKTSPQSWRFYFALRRRNTRYKNPQLVAQHCFVASFRRCFPFFTLRDQLVAQQKHLLRVKKVVAKSRARVYFERQILALLLVFHQTHNLLRNNFARALANQPISALHFFNPQQMFLLYLQTQIRFLIGGERVTCHWSKLSDALGRTKLNDALGKQQLELWTRT